MKTKCGDFCRFNGIDELWGNACVSGNSLVIFVGPRAFLENMSTLLGECADVSEIHYQETDNIKAALDPMQPADDARASDGLLQADAPVATHDRQYKPSAGKPRLRTTPSGLDDNFQTPDDNFQTRWRGQVD